MCFLFSHRSKLHTYDDVVERVAHQLGLDDPSKIRLTSHNCYSQQPKPQPIRYRGVEHLLDMLVHYNQVEFSFFVYSLSALLHFKTWNWFMLLFILMLHSRLLISCIMRFWTFHCQNCSVWKHLKLHSTMQQKTRFVSCLSLVPMLIFYSSAMSLRHMICQVVVHSIRLPRNSTISDVITDLKTKVITYLSFSLPSYLVSPEF